MQPLFLTCEQCLPLLPQYDKRGRSGPILAPIITRGTSDAKRPQTFYTSRNEKNNSAFHGNTMQCHIYIYSALYICISSFFYIFLLVNKMSVVTRCTVECHTNEVRYNIRVISLLILQTNHQTHFIVSLMKNKISVKK